MPLSGFYDFWFGGDEPTPPEPPVVVTHGAVDTPRVRLIWRPPKDLGLAYVLSGDDPTMMMVLSGQGRQVSR